MCLCSFLYPCRSLFYHTLLSRHWSQWSKKFYDDIPRNIYEKCNCNPFIVSICRKSNVYNLGIILSKCTESFGLPQQYMQLEMACNYSCSAFELPPAHIKVPGADHCLNVVAEQTPLSPYYCAVTGGMV